MSSGIWVAAGSVALALLYTRAFHNANLLVPLTALLIAAVVVLLWRYPRFAAYTVIASACLFEAGPLNWPDSLTDRVPFFWNVNSVLLVYGGIDIHAFPLNVLEVFLLLAGSISLFRAVYSRGVKVTLGSLFWPIGAYIAFVGWGWLHGMASGGDFKISLQEVRSQVYFLVAYLMAVNLMRTPISNSTHSREGAGVGSDSNSPFPGGERGRGRGVSSTLDSILWTIVLSIGFKGILYTVRRLHYVKFGGMAMPDQGVGSHEEAFLFDCFIVLLPVLLLWNVYPKLRRAMWMLMPFVVLGDLACARRAATAALLIVIPILMLAAYRALPARRRSIAWTTLALAMAFAIYFPIYKDGSGMLAQPARAIKSQFAPDARDKSSNDYRIAEEADLFATIKSSPVLGYGYGKRMFHAVRIADISKSYAWWDIMTHNQILWVWMRVGTIGFIVFWLMIASIVIAAGRIVQDPASTPENAAVALFTMLVVAALLIFGLLDLQLSTFRDMLFAGFWTGCVAAMPKPREVDAAPRGDGR